MEKSKSAIRIFEKSSEISFSKMKEGMTQLENLGLERNVIRASDICSNNNKTEPSLLASQIIPGLILLCLACEISLKLIHLQNSVAPNKSHDLKKLFKQLPIRIQNNIRESAVIEMNNTEDDFNTLLDENSLGFINWRYYYENSSSQIGSRGFLEVFLKFLKQNIKW